MSFEWKKYTIADVSKKVITGKTPPGTLDKYFGGEVLFVTPTDMGDNKYIELTQRTLSDEGKAKLAKQKFECGIVVSCIGWQMGKAAIVRNTAVTNQQINTIIPNGDLIDVDFLYYTLSEKRTEIFNLGATATRTPILKKSLFEKIEFHAPKLEQQKKIGNVLSSLDAKIINNKKINQTLEQMAQALFKSWFVDFEPVKAKMAVREAGGSQEDATRAAMTAISGKDADALAVYEREHPEQYAELKTTAELFPSAMQESSLGKVPYDWFVQPLSSVLNVLETGGRPKGGVSAYSEGIPSVGAENVIGVGKYNFDKEKYIPLEFFKNLKKGIVSNYDVLLYKDGGKPGEFKPRTSMFGDGFPYSTFAINEHVFRMRSEQLGQFYLYFQLSDERVLFDLANRGGKAAIPGINQNDVKTLDVIVPQKSILDKFNELASKNIKAMLINAVENTRLSGLRDTLLPKLLSGEITLPEAEQAVSEAENV